jgi:hypothetical protein
MYVRVSSINASILPTTSMYEVTDSRDVSRMVDVDPNGDIFWDSVEACSDPKEMIGINSLVEGPFKEKPDWPQSDRCIYEEMTQEAFELWFEKAQKYGNRRTHAGLIKAMDLRRNSNV